MFSLSGFLWRYFKHSASSGSGWVVLFSSVCENVCEEEVHAWLANSEIDEPGDRFNIVGKELRLEKLRRPRR